MTAQESLVLPIFIRSREPERAQAYLFSSYWLTQALVCDKFCLFFKNQVSHSLYIHSLSEDSMAIVRKQRRVHGKKQNYYWDDVLLIEVEAPPRKQHYTMRNPMQGLIGYAVMHDEQLKEGIYNSFANFNGTELRNGLTGISIKKLIELADVQSELYSTAHPDSSNHPAYDSALTMLLVLVRDRIDEWEECYRYDISNNGVTVLSMMRELGYDVDNVSGTISNTLNTVWDEGKLLVGADANKHWLKVNGLKKLVLPA